MIERNPVIQTVDYRLQTLDHRGKGWGSRKDMGIAVNKRIGAWNKRATKELWGNPGIAAFLERESLVSGV